MGIDDVSITANPPTITTLTPNTAVAGSAAFTLTVNGTNFVSGAAVYFNGTALTTTYVSATQLTAVVPVASVATAGTFPVTVRNTAGGFPSNALNFTVTTPSATPSLVAAPNSFTGLTTTTGTASAPSSYVLTGNSLPGAVTIIPDTGLEVSFTSTGPYVDSNGSLTATAADVTAAGGKTVYFRLAAVASPATYTNKLILNGAGSGSAALNADVTVSGTVTVPVPTINTPTFATAPLCATAATPLDVTFTATGTYDAANTFTVQLSDAAGSFAAPVAIATLPNNNLTTAQTVTATIPAGTPSGSGYKIRVVASTPATTSTGTSASLTLVSSPTVSIDPPGPQSYPVGSPGTTLTAIESFPTGTTRVWQVLAPSATAYTNITPAQTGLSYTPTFTTAGTYQVRVQSTFAACTAVTSNEVQIDVANAVPTLTTLAPSTAVVGGAAFTLTVNGGGFVNGAVVSFNGTPLTTAFVNAGQLTASVPASAIATIGSYAVTVTNPATGPSAALTFSVTAPLTACLSEGFEGGVVPANWASANATILAAAASSGNSGVSLEGSTNASTLTTPELTAPATLTFVLGRSSNTTSKTLIVEASTNGQTGTFTQVASYDNSNVTSGGFSPLSVSLPAPFNAAPSVWIRFRKPAGSTASPWRIDEVAVSCGTPTTPRISVAVGTTVVPNAGSYGMGTVAPGSSSAATTFTISNTGGGTLNLSGTPTVAVTGNTSEFSITQPSTTSLTAGASAPFTVTFSPTSNGVKTISLTIANNDGSPTRVPYVFTVRGTAAAVVPPATGNFATGELLLEEDFTYAPSAASLTALPGWAAHSSAGAGTPVKVIATSLSNPQYPAGPIGTNNQAESRGSSEDVNRTFSRPAPSNNTTLYLSALVKIGTLYGDTYFLHLLDNTLAGETGARGKLFVQQAVTGAYTLGLSVSGSTVASATFGSTVYGVDDNLLVVIKYVTRPGGNDEASLFVFPATAAPALEPATPTIGPLTEANSIGANSLNSVALRQDGSTPVYNVDGIRVATGWGAAVGKASFNQAAGRINEGNYYDLAVNNSDLLTATGPVNIENSLTLTSGNVVTNNASLLTLYAGATLSGGSATSFINGPIARVVPAGTTNTSYLFPVGKAVAIVNNYRPLMLNVASQGSTATLYRAEQVEGNPGQNGTNPAATNGTTLTRVSRIRSFSLTPYDPAAPANVVQPTGFSGTVSLSFDSDDRANLPGALVVAKRSDSSQPWANIGRTGNTGSTVTSDAFTSFSDFALATTDADLANNPLPVQLSSFGAQRQAEKAVAVQWTTATEKNADRFEVQRSLNAREFVTVATTKAQGTSSKATAYAVLDQTAPAAVLYYRLRQVDHDGTVAFSPVVTLSGTNETAKVLLYPNPTRSSLSFIAAEATPYRVLNQLGQPVLQGTTEAGTAKVNVETLPTGLYFIELQTPAGRSVQKFEKE